MNKELEQVTATITLILITMILIGLVLFSISNKEKAPESYIQTIPDKELDSIEFGDLYNKKNRIIKIAQFSFLSDLRDDLDHSLMSILKSREVSGDSKSIYFNQLLTRI